MSEASRIRRLYVENRLAELAWKYGPLPENNDHGAVAEPSWGPVGSLLQQANPGEYEHVLALDRDVRRTRGLAPLAGTEPEPTPEPPLPPTPAWTWDEYGESPILACPRCGEHSAKANIRIDLWNCTACQACGKAREWPGRHGYRPPEPPATAVHVV
jgi:hypothetical protein